MTGIDLDWDGGDNKKFIFKRGGQGTPGVLGLSPARSRAFMNLTLIISIAGLIKNYGY